MLLMSLACDNTQTANSNTGANTANTAASPSSTASSTSPERDKEAVTAVIHGVINDSQRATQNRDNVAADSRSLDKYFDDDVTIVDSSGFTKGWANYRDKNLVPQLRSVANNHKIADLNVTVIGDMALATYRYTLDADVNGKTTSIFGYGTTVLRRRGSDWKILHTQSSGRPTKDTDPKF
jgi:ketosteroid isomerase-like protein